MRGKKRTREMTWIDKENYKGSQSRLTKITMHKRSENGKLGVWKSMEEHVLQRL